MSEKSKQWQILFWKPEIKIEITFHFKHGFYPDWAKGKEDAIFEYWCIGPFEIRRIIKTRKMR